MVEQMSINELTGFIGMGDTVPLTKLHVVGNVVVQESDSINDLPGIAPYIHIGENQAGSSTDPAGELIIGHVSGAVVDDILGQVSFYSSDASSTATGRQVILRAICESSTGRNSGLSILTGSGTGAAEHFRVSALGKTSIISETTVAEELLVLDQNDTDEPFIDFQGSTGADTTSSISTNTASGATTHHIQIEINGTTAWIAASTNNPS